MLQSIAAALAVSVASATPPPPALDSMFAVAWRKSLVEPWLLEYKPIEPAGPQVDPLTGMVVVATRDGYVQVFNPEGTQLWYYEGRGPYFGSPAIGDGLVIVGGIDGRLLGLEAANGQVRWQYVYREEWGSQPLIQDGLVYVATLEGTVLALDAKTGEWRWHFRREPTARFTILGVGRPAIAKGVLYQGFADGSVVALDAKTGAVKWDRKVGRGDYPDVDATVQVAGDRLYVASYGGQVVALDRASGDVVWEAKAPLAYKARIDGDVLFVVTTTNVLAFDAKSGRSIWSTPLDGAPHAEPLPLKNLLVVANGKGLLVLDRRSGKKLRLFSRGSGTTAAPSMLGKRLYALSNAGELVAVDIR